MKVVLDTWLKQRVFMSLSLTQVNVSNTLSILSFPSKNALPYANNIS